MSTTSGRCFETASTASLPSPIEATTSTSARIPSSNSSASRKTWLSSTRRIRIGLAMNLRMLLGRQKQVVVRLAALLDVDLNVRMRFRDAAEQALERGLVLSDEQRQQLPRLAEEPLDDLVRDVVEVAAAHDRTTVREPEPVALVNREPVHLDVARGPRDLSGRDRTDRLVHLLRVLGRRSRSVERDHCRKARGNRARRHDLHRAIG